MTGEAAHVHLIDDQIFERNLQWPVALPVVVVENDSRAVWERRVPVRRAPPNVPAPNGAGVGVQQNDRGVETVDGRLPALGLGTAIVHAEPVFDGLVVEAQHGHVENVAYSEFPPNRLLGKRLRKHSAKGDLNKRLRGPSLKYHQYAIVGASREHREIDAARHHRGAERKGPARTYLVALVFVGRLDINALHVSAHPRDGVLHSVGNDEERQEPRGGHALADVAIDPRQHHLRILGLSLLVDQQHRAQSRARHESDPSHVQDNSGLRFYQISHRVEQFGRGLSVDVAYRLDENDASILAYVDLHHGAPTGCRSTLTCTRLSVRGSLTVIRSASKSAYGSPSIQTFSSRALPAGRMSGATRRTLSLKPSGIGLK